MMIGHDKSKFDNLPDKWSAEKLPNASWFQEGPGLRKWQFKDSGIKVINITNLVNGVLELDKTSRHISIEEFNKNYKHFECQSGDIVVASSGNSYCKHAIVRECDLPLVMNTSVIRFKPLNNCNYEYLNQFLKSKIFKDQIDFMITGGAQPNFGPVHLNQVTIPLPPLPEQQKIAEILSTVDAKIEVIDQQISETQALKKGLMQRLLTKGIGHTEFKDSSLGEIPKSWEVVTGEEISSTITKGASPKWQGFEYQNEGLLFVTSENVRDGLLDISKPKFLPIEFNEKIKKSKLKNGDILINIVGASIGRSCMYESNFEFANINQAICLLRVKSELLSTYILYYLQHEETINRLLGAQNGSARQNLSLTDIRKFKFVIPSEVEQQKMIEIFASISDKLEVLYEKKTYYQELKQGLMQQLLTGKIRVKINNTVTA